MMTGLLTFRFLDGSWAAAAAARSIAEPAVKATGAAAAGAKARLPGHPGFGRMP
jgi:hypothetical protein